MDEKKMWALFSIDNNYDQPDNNLVAWWTSRPSFEVLLGAMGGSFDLEASIIAAANVMQGGKADYNYTQYRLENISEGVLNG